ncbi:MAG: DALR anticodon-binding domain-containing protein, partial [Mycobacterium leprae]
GELCSEALLGYQPADGVDALKALNDMLDFFKARAKVQMEQRNIRYDVIDAVLTVGFRDITDAMKRAEALNQMLNEPEFAAVSGALKRVRNLAGKAEEVGVTPGAVNTELLNEQAERELYGAFVDLRPVLKRTLDAGHYEEFYRTATKLKAPVDAFLDNVRVNADDPAVKANRYSLLTAVGTLLSAPADLGKLAG